ncbi:hypothetical protein Tco_1297422, partial [Tanacetum coccineum]
MFKEHFFADLVFGLLDMLLLSLRCSLGTSGGVEMSLIFFVVVVDDLDDSSARFAIIAKSLSEAGVTKMKSTWQLCWKD